MCLVSGGRSESCCVRSLVMTPVPFCVRDPLKGHLGSGDDVIRSSHTFLPITSDRIGIETWVRCQHV